MRERDKGRENALTQERDKERENALTPERDEERVSDGESVYVKERWAL